MFLSRIKSLLARYGLSTIILLIIFFGAVYIAQVSDARRGELAQDEAIEFARLEQQYENLNIGDNGTDLYLRMTAKTCGRNVKPIVEWTTCLRNAVEQDQRIRNATQPK